LPSRRQIGSDPPLVDTAHRGDDRPGTAGSTPSAANFHLYLNGAPNTGKVGFGNGYLFGTAQGTTSVGDGGWHNIIGVYDGAGGSARICVDAVQQIAGPLSSTPNTGTANPWRIGLFQGGGQYFKGAIDDLRIYNRALSGADVQALFDGR
jgi:hypothetical protein